MKFKFNMNKPELKKPELKKDPTEHLRDAMLACQSTMMELMKEGDKEKIKAMAGAMSHLSKSISEMYSAESIILLGVVSNDKSEFWGLMERACKHLQRSGDAAEAFALAAIGLPKGAFNALEQGAKAVVGKQRGIELEIDFGVKSAVMGLITGVFLYAKKAKEASKSLHDRIGSFWGDANARANMMISPVKTIVATNVSELRSVTAAFKAAIVSRYDAALDAISNGLDEVKADIQFAGAVFGAAKDAAGNVVKNGLSKAKESGRIVGAAFGEAFIAAENAVGTAKGMTQSGVETASDVVGAVGSVTSAVAQDMANSAIKMAERAMARVNESVAARIAKRLESAYLKAQQSGSLIDLDRQLTAHGGVNFLMSNGKTLLESTRDAINNGDGSNDDKLNKIESLLLSHGAIDNTHFETASM